MLIFFYVMWAGKSALAQDLPDLGDPSRDDFSPFQEQTIGASIMGNIRSRPAYVSDPEIADYLNHLGYQLVANSDSPATDFYFFVLINQTLNAFALPGGYVGVHSGLILDSDNESMLAGVLAHEIAHVTQRHIARVIAGQSRVRIGSLAAMAAAILAARSNGDVAQAAVMTSAALPIQSQLNFTREHEREADRIGLRILKQAKFDPHQVPLFFKYLQRQSRLYESGIPDYLRTHPINSERIADIEARLAKVSSNQVEDSIALLFVKARLRIYQDGSLKAIELFKEQLNSQDKKARVAGMYGLLCAQIFSNELNVVTLDEARAELDTALSFEPGHPMLLSLEADFERLFGDLERADALYAEALVRYPTRKSLAYGYAELLLSSERFTDLEKLMSNLVWNAEVRDSRYYEYRAKAYAGLKRKMAMHLDYAEGLALKGNLVGAINELLSAQRATDGDFFLRTSVVSRLRELEEMQRALEK
ncbi:MAG: M48 family metalloprotease [Proteobacteria bacterium]|nr:M48 family metalloprotease [Pseudomonadota bacterium]